MKQLRIYLILLVSLALTVSCEEEGTPLTLQDFYNGGVEPTIKFLVELNGFQYQTDSIEGVKSNRQLVLSVSDQNVNYVIATEELRVGSFSGLNNDLKNYVNYLDAAGVLFSTTKNGNASDAVIQITSFNERSKKVSGLFSGTLHSQNSNLKLKITNGQFKDVSVDIPFVGELNANIEGLHFDADACIFTSTNNSGIILETIAGTSNLDTLSISITVEENIQVKEYDLVSDPVTARYNSNTFSTNIFKNQYTSESGKLNITKIDSANNRIEGSFNFTARNFLNESVQINNGSFKALIQ